MNRRLIGIACGTGLLIAAAVAVVASLNRRQPLPEVPVEVPTAEVRVKAVGEKSKPYAGTALYSLAEDSRKTRAQKAEGRDEARPSRLEGIRATRVQKAEGRDEARPSRLEGKRATRAQKAEGRDEARPSRLRG